MEMTNKNIDNNNNNYNTDTELTIQLEQNNIKSEKKILVNNENTILKNMNKKIDTKKKFKYKKKGNVILIYYNNSNKPQIVIGPEWRLFILGFSFFIFYSFLIFVFTFGHTNFIFEIIGFILTLIQLSCYLLSFLINPGIQFKKPYKNDDESERCNYCGVIKSSTLKQKHCITCNVCILGYDHHCSWTGKCIGYKNKIYFRIFMFLCVFNFVYMIILISSTYQMNPNYD